VITGDDAWSEGDRFVIVDDLRGGGLNGKRGTLIGWNKNSGSLIRAAVDGDHEETLFYHSEIALLPIIERLAELGRTEA
jgi:hypothetical protein